jgi:PhnB protein
MGTATARQTNAPSATPQVLGGVAPYLTVSGADAAAEFYKHAFGADEVFRHPGDERGRTMHIHESMQNRGVLIRSG